MLKERDAFVAAALIEVKFCAIVIVALNMEDTDMLEDTILVGTGTELFVGLTIELVALLLELE